MSLSKTSKLSVMPSIVTLLSILMIAGMSSDLKAQLNPLNEIYFQNQYLGNPAMAGLQGGLKINVAYRKQWATMPGSPTTKSLSANYKFMEKGGVGLSVYNDQSGLIKRTRVMGTYAYHLPLDGDNKKLSMGISLGFMGERVAMEDVDGDPNDASVNNFNTQDTYLDGDFGAAYTSDNLTVQASVPNLKNTLKKDESNAVDRSTFFTAASYKFSLTRVMAGFGIEPKLVFRGVKGYDNIMDIGSNFTFNTNQFNVMAMYHSSKSATLGFGVELATDTYLMGMFTSETSQFRKYTGATFEIGLRLNLF